MTTAVVCDNFGKCHPDGILRQQAVGDMTLEQRGRFLGEIGWLSEEDDRHLCPFCHAKRRDTIEPMIKLRKIFEGSETR